MTLIAEAGNTHFGCLDTAKEMIHVARDCGADLIKFQAIEADFVAQYGSMPKEFYQHVSFKIEEYEELIEVGNLIGIPVFFSIFGGSLKPLAAKTFHHKVSGKQSPHFHFAEFMDKDSTFVSVNPNYGSYPKLEKATMLYCTEYLPRVVNYDEMLSVEEYYGRPIGYSDHTIGIEACLSSLDRGAVVIEKHFTLTRDFTWEGQVFRDTIHSALPNQLQKLANAIKGG